MASKNSNPGKLSIKSKIWIEDESGKVVFGTGRLRILELVDRYGSIHAAAKELKMSYRAVWGKIKATEERLGQSLWRTQVLLGNEYPISGASSTSEFPLG